MKHATTMFLPRASLQSLLHILISEGYECIAPVIKDGVIVYRPVQDASQLPTGFRDQQEPGRYQYEITNSVRQFAWANGSQCLKPLVFKPREALWRSTQSSGKLVFDLVANEDKPKAVIGVRSCDLAGLALSDAHFIHADIVDDHYQTRREHLFLVAMNCSHPAANCFCSSTGDGPSAESGADLILDELEDGFACRAGSIRGMDLLIQLPLAELGEQQKLEVRAQRQHAIDTQQRQIPSMHGRLSMQATAKKWDAIADRCLSCGNCTAVCPSCFCNTQREQVSLDLQHVEQVREWDSCFHTDHSYIHGFVVRSETKHRYRQWLTHKFDYWHDQYGRSGCVGCGRCITWCPVGIDVTEELNGFAEDVHG